MELTVQGKVVRAATGGRPLGRDEPLVVFLHAAGGNRTFWSLQTRSIAARGRAVLAVDLPGHGGSRGPALAHVETLAAWALDVIAAAGWSRATLVGHSLGALVALQAAADDPSAVTHLALIAGAAAMPVNPVLLQTARDDPAHAWELVVEWALSPASRRSSHTTLGHGAGSSILATAETDTLHTDFAAADRYEAGSEAADRVTCPTLLIHGDQDRMVRVDAAYTLAETIPGSRIVLLAGVGHFPMLENPDALLDALATLLY